MKFYKIFLLMAVALFFIENASANHIQCGDTITQDTVLDNNLLNCTDSGIAIGADDITLDCNGHTIHGIGDFSIGNGIYALNKRGFTIMNCNIYDFYDGINLYSSHDNFLFNNIISNNNNRGISIFSSDNNLLEENNVNFNDEGTYIYSSLNNTLLNNKFNSNFYFGLALTGLSKMNNVEGNEVSSNHLFGIRLIGSSNNNIIGNKAKLNKEGINIYSSNNNTIIGNMANSNAERGIHIFSSSLNLLKNNRVLFNYIGIGLSSSSNNALINNAASDNSYGFYAFSSLNNNMEDNVASNNGFGIVLDGEANNNYLKGNEASFNDNKGMWITSSSGNVLEWNKIKINDEGIRLSSSNNNQIYNNLFDNSNNAFDDGINFWNTTMEKGDNIAGGKAIGGNFWSDYNGIDLNGDSIGDTNLPYNSNGNIVNGGDFLPLVRNGVNLH